MSLSACWATCCNGRINFPYQPLFAGKQNRCELLIPDGGDDMLDMGEERPRARMQHVVALAS